MYFALRGSSELRALKPQQITVNWSTLGEKYLLYRDIGLMNNPGGLHHKQVGNKEASHYGNMPISLVILLHCMRNISKCPPNAEFLFLQSIHLEIVGTIIE